jgi:formyl-CoA transferase
MAHHPASQALKRITVLDLTRVRSGPTAVRQLADWGANVIKVEMPERIEPDGALGARRHTADFQNLQRNKRSMTLDLKSPEGLDVLKRMAARADVVVENFRPEVKHRLGVDYEALSALNPRLIYASISGFGQDGPYGERPGFDQIAQGMGGLMSITGLPGQGPVRVGIPVADLCAGLFCALGILVAIIEREESGKGQWIKTSLLEAQVFMLDFQAARWLVDHEVPGQAGNNHPTSTPTGVFATSDGHINLGVAGERIWQRFCAAIDADDFLANPDYASNAGRLKRRDALNAEIERRLEAHDTKTWIERLSAAGVPCGEINSIDQVFADPQVKHLGIAQAVDSPKLGRIDLVRQPMTLSRTPSALETPPPERGEHTDEVLGEFGYTAEEITDLRRSNVL